MANSASVKSDSYDGRYYQLTVTQDGTSSKLNYSLSSVGGNDNYYACSPIEAWVGSTCIYNDDNSHGWSYSKNPPIAKGEFASGSVDPGYGTTWFSLTGRPWWTGAGTAKENYIVTTKPISTPSINTPSVTNIKRTTADASFSVSNNGGASIVDHYIDAGTTNFGNVKSTITGSSGTFSGLSANTLYYVRANASNGSYRGYSSVTHFTTSGNAPSVDAWVSSVARTAVQLGCGASYDTNAEWKSTNYQWGTTSNYGNNDGDGWITGLNPNTTYYYRAGVTDNFSRTGWSSGKSFTTPGNAPTVTTSTSNVTYNSAKVNYNASYDTNASYKSLAIQYGTTANYGSNSTSQTLGSLSPNTTYHYKITITDNWNRSGAATGSFTTSKPAAPTISSITTPTVQDKSIKVQLNATAGAGAASLQYRFSKDNGSTYTSWQSANNYTFTGLQDDTSYTFKAQVKDNYGTTSTSSSASATTAWVESVKVITSSGAKSARVYIINSSGSKKIHKRNIKTI